MHRPLNDNEIAYLRKQKLVEGRKSSLYFDKSVARSTGQEAEYTVMKRFNPSELCINIYDVPNDPLQPMPQNYGISYRLIEEYENNIEKIDGMYPPFYDPANDIAKATFTLLLLIALCFTFSGHEHSASYLLFPAILIPAAIALNCYLKKRNYQKRRRALKNIRSEIIEKYLHDLYEWYNRTHEYKSQYYDII